MFYKSTCFFIAAIFFRLNVFAQWAPFNISLEPINVSGLEGVQSYAIGQHQGKWLIIGGRIEGLHQRQPFASFNKIGKNFQLLVIDPVGKKRWSADLSSLSQGLKDQLSSSNMQFYQNGNQLYLVGGYGYSEEVKEHVTYGYLTAVDVPALINAITNGAPFNDFFRQISDPMFEVTGGRMDKIYDTYYLVGGQNFKGRYNPMGSEKGPGFIQEYTNQIRKFHIHDDGVALYIEQLQSITDSIHLHRRDYNVLPQIFANGQEGLTAFSGVFQPDRDLPFLNCINIDSTGHRVNDLFNQFYNHYHCATLPLYSRSTNEMHNLFFGGIAQYYDESGLLVQDNNVPFVRTISRVTRTADGRMAEYKLPVEMPSLQGAGAEFIAVQGLPQYANGVIKLDELSGDTIHVGYIYGGIQSSVPNIFWVNDGSQSSASSSILKVNLIRNNLSVAHALNEQSVGSLKVRAFANPDTRNFTVRFHLTQKANVQVIIKNAKGKTIDDKLLLGLSAGENMYRKSIKNLDKKGIYFLTVLTEYEKATQKIVVDP